MSTGKFGNVNRRVHQDVLGLGSQEERFDMMQGMPGEIVSFDASKQTATIKIMYKPKFNGKAVEPPELLEVPIDQPRGGGFAMTKPMQAGDPVRLNFGSRDQDEWQETGQQSEANTSRAASLSDARAVPSGYPATKAMASYDASNAFFGTEDNLNGHRISPDGKHSIEGNGEELLTIVHELLNLLTSDKAVVTTGSSIGEWDLKLQPQYALLKARLEKMKLK